MSSYLDSNDSDDPGDKVVDLSKTLVKALKAEEELQDKYIRCKDCDASFLFSKEEQSFFKDKKLEYAPCRCHNCRVLKRTQSKFARRKSVTAVVCISCKSLTYVPFKPKGHSPVYCRYCMYKKNSIVG